MNDSISVAGVTVTKNDKGATVQYGWIGQQVSMEDVLKLRDWLNLNFPENSK